MRFDLVIITKTTSMKRERLGARQDIIKSRVRPAGANPK
jgi:hypothetical protein